MRDKNLKKATHSKEIRKILKEALHDNKDLNLYLEFGSKHAKLTGGVHHLTILLIAKRQKKREKL